MALSSPLPPEQQRRIDAELESGERILWAGQPSPGRMARMGIVPCLFGIPFTAFALFWTGMAGGFAFFPLFGLIFVAVGIGLLLTPLWLTLKAQRTVYAVTDQRVLLLNGTLWGGTNIRSLGHSQLQDISRTQQGDGSGDLIFPQATTFSYQPGSNSYNGDGIRTYNSGRYVANTVGFYGIADARAVEDTIRQTFQKGKPSLET